MKNASKKFLVRCSYLEIYNEDVRDLLSSDIEKKLELKEDVSKNVYVKDLSIYAVKSIKEIEQYMAKGSASRKTGATAMNDTSSRSHSIFTIYLETSEDVRNSCNSFRRLMAKGGLNKGTRWAN
jgi:hypothetical protein